MAVNSYGVYLRQIRNAVWVIAAAVVLEFAMRALFFLSLPFIVR